MSTWLPGVTGPVSVQVVVVVPCTQFRPMEPTDWMVMGAEMVTGEGNRG
jgi:hypothetical protein